MEQNTKDYLKMTNEYTEICNQIQVLENSFLCAKPFIKSNLSKKPPLNKADEKKIKSEGRIRNIIIVMVLIPSFYSIALTIFAYLTYRLADNPTTFKLLQHILGYHFYNDERLYIFLRYIFTAIITTIVCCITAIILHITRCKKATQKINKKKEEIDAYNAKIDAENAIIDIKNAEIAEYNTTTLELENNRIRTQIESLKEKRDELKKILS